MTVVAPPTTAKQPPRRGQKHRSRHAKAKHGSGRGGMRPIRRWPKRAFFATGGVLLLVILLGVSAVIYLNYRLGQIKTQNCAACVAASTGQPFTVLLIGSDSRQFVDDSQEQSQFGDSADAGGQRSDVTIVARVVPATHQVLMMSIPRDLWVDIPGNVANVSGMNRINAAFNNGPSLLVQTIETDLGIPINDFAEVNFPGFEGMVNSLGGIYLNFSVPVKDQYSGLKITKTGCQLVEGSQALALVRSRHLYYYENGTWNADVQSDFSRIQRQDVFFRALIARVHEKDLDPLSINALVGGLTTDITVDPAFKGRLLGLAEAFHSVGANALKTETLPTTEITNSAGDVLQAAQPYADSMIKDFNAFGDNTSSKSTSTTAKKATTIPVSDFHVQVLNGNGISGAAAGASTSLAKAGYRVSGTGNASSYSYTSNQIQYAPGHEAAAKQFEAAITGSSTLVEDPSLTGNDLILTIGSDFDGLAGSSSTNSDSSSTSTTTAIPPSNVVTNTQIEPWNPTVCSG